MKLTDELLRSEFGIKSAPDRQLIVDAIEHLRFSLARLQPQVQHLLRDPLPMVRPYFDSHLLTHFLERQSA